MRRIKKHPIPTNQTITRDHVKDLVENMPVGEWVPTKEYSPLVVQAARISGYRIDTKMEMKNGSRQAMKGYYRLVG